MPSPGHSDDDESDEVEGDEDHIYQSLERKSRADDMNVVYAMPLKHRKVQSCVCVFGWVCLWSALMHLLIFTTRWSF